MCGPADPPLSPEDPSRGGVLPTLQRQLAPHGSTPRSSRGGSRPAPPHRASACSGRGRVRPPHAAPPDHLAALTMARMPARTAGARSAHAATTAANSGSSGFAGVGFGAESPESAPHFAPPESETPVFPDDSGGCSSPALPISFLNLTIVANPRGLSPGVVFFTIDVPRCFLASFVRVPLSFRRFLPTQIRVPPSR